MQLLIRVARRLLVEASSWSFLKDCWFFVKPDPLFKLYKRLCKVCCKLKQFSWSFTGSFIWSWRSPDLLNKRNCCDRDSLLEGQKKNHIESSDFINSMVTSSTLARTLCSSPSSWPRSSHRKDMWTEIQRHSKRARKYQIDFLGLIKVW